MLNKFDKSYAVTLIAVVVMSLSCIAQLTSCDSTNKYVGSWYYIDNPSEDVFIFTEDDRFSRYSEGGTISKTEDGLLLTDEWGYTETMTESTFQGESALVTSDGRVYINNYDVAYEYHESQVAEEVSNQEVALIGEWTDPSGHTMILDLNDDGTYLITGWAGQTESGTWSSGRDGDYLKIYADMEETTFSYDGSYIDGASVLDYPLNGHELQIVKGTVSFLK